MTLPTSYKLAQRAETKVRLIFLYVACFAVGHSLDAVVFVHNFAPIFVWVFIPT